MTPRFQVSDFIAVVNQSLDMAFGAVEVEGEVSSFNINQQKFVFFDLKDGSGSVGCFMMVFNLRTPIEDGMRVVVRAIPKLTDKGKFSLTVQAIKPVGEGSIKKSLMLLKNKLSSEGLFDFDRKRRLPVLPSRVAIISSVQAAGYADFIKIADERWGSVKFEVANVKVQGVGAADQIIRAINYFNESPEPPEVLVIIRGGGSADDLAAFNDEKLVRAVAGSRVPTLTGIGHETDESLVDLVADVQASTPSNAAQILLPDKRDFINRQHDELSDALEVALDRVSETQDRVGFLWRDLVDELNERLDFELENLSSQVKMIDEFNPERILKKGYAILRGEMEVGSVVKITTSDKILTARIEGYEQR